ncbi:hypothetical protein T4D_7233 [Trichinella pseudospiralis]|uniref:Uncharacterized protein n=1 Tax=Trichinella pseudospiralis TaxID=6337 RepID=A0A0V1FJQ7_TRIPS|nr:hypothetical protein T4D_7233 [Trichinella pseudospiralis]
MTLLKGVKFISEFSNTLDVFNSASEFFPNHLDHSICKNTLNKSLSILKNVVLSNISLYSLSLNLSAICLRAYV